MSQWLHKRRDRFGQREVVPAALAAIALITFMLYDRAFDVIDGPITCGFRVLTGLPCAGCGLTRSVVALGNGSISQSLSEHPLGSAIVLVLSAIVVSWAVGLVRNRPARPIVTRGVMSAFAVGFAVIWLARLF